MGRITIHVVPRARTTEISGTHGDAIRVRVAAPPAGGAANAALLRFLADTLDLPVSRVSIASGALGRRKVIAIEGRSAADIRAALTPTPSP